MNKHRREQVKQAKAKVILWRKKANGGGGPQALWNLEGAEYELHSLRHPGKWYAEERLTRSYDDGYAHLDKWGQGGHFTTLSITDPIYGDCQYGDNWERRFLIKVPKGLSDEVIGNILSNAFSRYCTCAHDCCGHIYSYMNEAKKVKRREWLVTVHYAINC